VIEKKQVILVWLKKKEALNEGDRHPSLSLIVELWLCQVQARLLNTSFGFQILYVWCPEGEKEKRQEIK
jgi:hypothetical protein